MVIKMKGKTKIKLKYEAIIFKLNAKNAQTTNNQVEWKYSDKIRIQHLDDRFVYSLFKIWKYFPSLISLQSWNCDMMP